MEENTELKRIPWICMGHGTVDLRIALARAHILVTSPLSLWIRGWVQSLELGRVGLGPTFGFVAFHVCDFEHIPSVNTSFSALQNGEVMLFRVAVKITDKAPREEPDI